jgi:hypothetical protein
VSGGNDHIPYLAVSDILIHSSVIVLKMASNDAALGKESQTALINSLAIIFVSLSTASVILRIYTRSRLLGVFGTDDVTICIAQTLAIAVSVTTILGTCCPPTKILAQLI